MKKYWEWPLLLVLGIAGCLLWGKLSLPRYQAIDLSVDQAKAETIAKQFLKAQYGIAPQGYRTAVRFNVDESTDRYLQKTLGNRLYQDLIRRLHYDLFVWIVRFFKERQKEEYKVAVSSATGEVVGFSHVIEDTAFRPTMGKEKARAFAIDFLKKQFGFSPDRFLTHSEETKKYDNRVEYAFSWQKKGIEIPWKKGSKTGTAKLMTTIEVSGNEVLSFGKQQFSIPDAFNRYVDNLKQIGQNLTLIFRLFYLALITIAIVVVVNRKHQVVTRSVKWFYIGAGTVMFVLMVLDVLNSFQDLLFEYPTTQSFGDYLVRQLVENVIGPFFIAVAFVLPALAGEALRFEVAPQQKTRSILSNLLSSFRSFEVSRQIFTGYLAAGIVLGAQALIYDFGFKHWGVWDELSWLAQASTSMVPAFTALVIGFQAAFSEESMFRLFAINLFKKHRLPMAAAVFLSALMWGFGHTGYEIFPMWFRGVEVTCIGIIMGILYLRFGFICVLTAHFLIDAFLSNLPYFINHQHSVNFYEAFLVIALPLLLAFVALIFDCHAAEKPLSIRFNAQQEFNYRLLMEICRSKTTQELAVLRKELERHGWDAAIIQRVFDGIS